MIELLTQVSPLLIAVIIAALIFDFVNGWNDSANAIATVVSTRVLSPIAAVILAAIFNLIGAMTGTEVAKTVTAGLIRTDVATVTPEGVLFLALSAMLAAIVWAGLMTQQGMPISGSHSMIGGLIGGGLAAIGFDGLIWSGLWKVFLAMLVSPVLGAAVAFVLMLIGTWICAKLHAEKVQAVFRRLQIGSAALMAFNHGLNDAQKVMGIITMACVAGGLQYVPPGEEATPELWVKIACATMISLGTAMGGWKVIRTLGAKLSRLTPFDGFQAETAASGVLFLAAYLGVPVSTTHTITGSIVGVGLSKGTRSVKWIVGEKIILAWVFTLPMTIAMGFVFHFALVTLL